MVRGHTVKRRWTRVACVSYDPEYETYLGRLDKEQPHPVFKSRKTAVRHARREIGSIQKMGFKAKVWSPLPMHRDSSHIHIVVLITSKELQRRFPTEANLDYLTAK
jgi:hypothetical protein